MKNKLICRFALNTAFIENNYYEFTKATVDPDSVIKDERISEHFKIECYFTDFCQRCDPSMAIHELCERCIKNMENDLGSWKIIGDILDVSLIILSIYANLK